MHENFLFIKYADPIIAKRKRFIILLDMW